MVQVVCPFNSGHRMPAESLAKHVLKCPDRTTAPPAKRAASIADAPQEKRARHGPVTSRTSSTTLAHLSERTFKSVDMHPALQCSLEEVFGYTTMTHVQDSVMEVCMAGSDVVAKAKTGTGKTLAFLIPALHNVLHAQAKTGIQVLVLSPTRELAMQTAEESKTLLHFLPEHKTMTMLGGTNMAAETRSFREKAPLVLVATPGRLNDHLENSGLVPLLRFLQVLIFDEADQLLDMGFRPAIEKILGKLNQRESRQTMLFSATFPVQLQAVTNLALRPAHEVVDCIGAAEEATNQQVEQVFSVCAIDDLFASVLNVIEKLIQEPHKIIVFLPTARETGLHAALFGALNLHGTEIMEIHSRKSQNQRTKISDHFRSVSEGILFSSDVSARGMDYPDVTFVLQIGAPSDRAQYLHRLGRTARAGKEGSGLLLLCDFERYFLKLLGDLPVRERPAFSASQLEEAKARVESALPIVHATDPQIGTQAYQAWLGDRNSQLRKLGWSQTELVEWANYFATSVMQLSEVPSLEAKTVNKMGLSHVPGIVVAGRASGMQNGKGKGKGKSKGAKWY